MPKINTTAIFAIFLFTCVIFTAVNYHNIDALESRINTVKKYYKYDSDKYKSERLFKEDYYIIQQERDTTLLLAVFGAVGILVAFLTYQNVQSRFELKINELTTQYDLKSAELKNEITAEINKYKKEWKQTKDHLFKLELTIYTNGAQYAKQISNFYLNQNELPKYLLYSLAAASQTASYCILLAKYDETNNQGIPPNFETFFVKLSQNIGGKLEVYSASLKVMEDYIQTIRKLNNREINKILSDIHAKLIEIPNPTE